jgi:MerR family redox-sensitive transcriptional activator SoxR
MMDEMSIGQVAKEAGIKTSKIRYYEEIGLLPEARRVRGQRRYNAGILQTLTTIQFAQQAGFTLTEIQDLFQTQETHHPLSEKGQQLVQEKLMHLEQLSARIDQMKTMLVAGLACACQKSDDCILVDSAWVPMEKPLSIRF